MFSGLRPQSLFYILEKGESPILKVGQVVSVSNPQSKFGQFTPNPMFGQPTETTVDVTVKVGEETVEYKQLPSNLSIANSDQSRVVVSDSREAMSSEVEAMLRTSKGILESVPYHNNVITSCDSILRELNPQFAKEKEQEEKIGILEKKMGSIETHLAQISGLLSKQLTHSDSNPKNIEDHENN